MMKMILFMAAVAEETSEGGGVLEAFGVAWPNLLAQIIVFVIILFVLSRFAFKPLLAQLENRKKQIAETLENSEKIKKALAEAEQNKAQILSEANRQATAMIEEAQKSASLLGEKKIQEAIAQAEVLIQKAREATELDRERMMTELKAEVGRLVIETTSKVTGKVLTDEDQRRLREETTNLMAA